MHPGKPSSKSDTDEADWLEIVRRNVSSLRFGSVQITVHNGRVTQVDSIEKTRLIQPETGRPATRT